MQTTKPTTPATAVRPAGPARPRALRPAWLTALGAAAVAALAAGCATTASSAPLSTAPASASARGHAATASTAAHNPSSATSSAGCGSSSAAAGEGQPSLAAIQFADDSHGWAVGADRILATSDGGRTWTRQYSGPAELYQVDFTDVSHGWAVGAGALLRTSDGGATWTALSEPCRAIDAVSFVSPGTGYAIAGGGETPVLGSLMGSYSGSRLLRTTDGGASWQRLSGTPADPQSACFTSAAGGYLGTPGRIWRTSDGGQTWSLAFTEPAAAKGFGKQLDTPELQCAGPAGAWVLFLGTGAAMMHSPYLAYATQDGQTWRGVLEERMLESAIRPSLHLPDGPGSEPGPFSAISPAAAAFLGSTPPANGWGAAPLALATNNGGTLRNDGDVSAINEPFAAAFRTPEEGWVVGENLQTKTFAIEATANAGHTWTTEYQTA